MAFMKTHAFILLATFITLGSSSDSKAMTQSEQETQRKRRATVFRAAKNDNPVQLLGSLDATNINSTDKDSFTPLLWAARNDSHQCIPFLLQAKADPRVQDKRGNTPLDWAIRNRNLTTVKDIIAFLPEMNNLDILSAAARTARN